MKKYDAGLIDSKLLSCKLFYYCINWYTSYLKNLQIVLDLIEDFQSVCPQAAEQSCPLQGVWRMQRRVSMCQVHQCPVKTNIKE